MTLKCIAGIETPDEGHIELNGRVLYDSDQKINLKPQKRKVGYLFQNYALFPNMTVEQNITCAIAGTKEEKQKLVAEMLEQFKLPGLGKRYPSQLSGGQQQRVALARILAYNPEVLLLDEPFSALDAYLKETLQIEMIDLLRLYKGDAIMVTHSRDEVYKISDELLVMHDGKVVDMGNTKKLFKKPRHIEVARLSGCKNFSRAKKISENSVELTGWDTQFTVEGPIPNKLSHIGVRAHDFYPAQEGDVNALKVQALKEIESPFEWNVLFRNAASIISKDDIWWIYTKKEGITETPGYLAVDPSSILLLVGEDLKQTI